MKIAILSTIENYEWAGTEEVWAQFAQLALQQGHQIHVSVHKSVAKSPQIQELLEQGIEISIRKPFRPTRLFLLKEKYWSDMRAVKQFSPDILLINSGSLYDVLNIPALHLFCLNFDIPKVFFCHFVAEGFVPISRDNVRKFAEIIKGWVFVAQHNQILAERQLAYHFKDFRVILNNSRLLLSEPLPLPNNEIFQLACVARLETQWKGHDVLLEILSQPQWGERSWHLNLYGTGLDKDYIQQLINHYNLTERVTCHGYIRDIKAVWKKNHLMVLASRGEGTPLAVLEAMMCGRPTVTTDVGGNREILEHGKTGWIAEAATPHSFNYILDNAWRQRNSWPEMGRQAHIRSKKISEHNPSQKLLNYIIELLNN